MIRGHDEFEVLAGAVALGEATPCERERFEAHAATCVTCRGDVGGFAAVRDRIIAARDEETWRPALGSELMAVIRAQRLRRARFTFRALTWSVALSLVVDAAFVSGLTTYAGQLLHDAALSNVVAAIHAQTR